MNKPLILSLSPRAKGNSDAAADVLAASTQIVPLRLRDFNIAPCMGCGACARSGQCVLAKKDRAEELFTRMESAPGLVLTAPVYFYHLPAQAKAFIDRAQSRYLARLSGMRPKLPKRRAYAVLLAGQPRGERLFEGILITLRYFLDVFDYELVDTALVRGVDGPGDLLATPKAMGQLGALQERMMW